MRLDIWRVSAGKQFHLLRSVDLSGITDDLLIGPLGITDDLLISVIADPQMVA